ncbi:MAG: 3-oxoacyl-ACP synthase [Spirochaetes bacterium]|nr:MAG: 3-oxoacyl-ACP synthase [Spirochaetota bacterium]
MSSSMKQKPNKIEEIKDEDINYSDIPELDEEFWKNAVIEYPKKKRPVTIRLDVDILEWFKSMGKGYQTKINAILRSYYEAHKKRKVS